MPAASAFSYLVYFSFNSVPVKRQAFFRNLLSQSITDIKYRHLKIDDATMPGDNRHCLITIIVFCSCFEFSVSIGYSPLVLCFFKIEPGVTCNDARGLDFTVKRFSQAVQCFGDLAVIVLFDGLKITHITHFLNTSCRPRYT